MSRPHVYFVGASGTAVKEHFTVPHPCKDPDDVKTKHSFLLSNHCPINLLGKDLMIALEIFILSTVEGLKIIKTETIFNQMVNVNYSPLTFAY